MRLSVRNCLIMRERLAPNAVRTATPFWRAADRASNMCATLAHAMSSTKPAAPSSTSSVGRTSPTTLSLSGVTVTPPLVPGNSRSSRAVMVAISARACASVTPGASRAKTRSVLSPRSVARSASGSGAHSSACVAQKGANWNSFGITPITAYGSPSSATMRPTTDGSAPKLRRQSP
jgi:hypothetical protein